jgi:hypothetical protein
MARIPIVYTEDEAAVRAANKRLKQVQYCKNWVAKNQDKQRQISADYYALNKVEYNRKCAIRLRNKRELEKSKKDGNTENTDP